MSAVRIIIVFIVMMMLVGVTHADPVHAVAFYLVGGIHAYWASRAAA